MEELEAPIYHSRNAVPAPEPLGRLAPGRVRDQGQVTARTDPISHRSDQAIE